jgi:hypothetical protein
MIDFMPFQKIPRLNRECVITEKIDGTNACIHITEGGDLYAGSRNRWISPADDNYGFATWAYSHAPELVADLGPGTHFGEWWGANIQRSYGLKERRFSLFNTSRWGGENPTPRHCHVVPVLYRGIFSTLVAKECLEELAMDGSIAAPGHKTPEGIIIYHTAANAYFKATIHKDDERKGASA